MTPSPLPGVVAGPFTLTARWTGRIAGLDLARAIALIGMFAAHIGDSGTRGADQDGWPWLWVFDGRASAIFAVLAGVTIALMGAKDSAGTAHTVVRVATRGALLMAAGYAVGALDTPVDVILTNLGLMFVLVLPFLRVRPPVLLAAAGVAFTLGSVASRVASDSLDGWRVVEKLVSHHYPALAWAGYVLVGMAIGKTDLRARGAALMLVWRGAIAAGLSYGTGILLGGAAPWSGMDSSTAPGVAWASVAPHSNTSFELSGNTGVALVVIGLCVAAARPSRWTLPLLAFGSMSLTMYTAHILVIAAVGDSIVWQPSNVALVVLTLALMGAATAWRVWIGAGPLEQAVTKASTRLADATASIR